jgi:phosphoribosylformylglycinamidine cyclo-ligase
MNSGFQRKTMSEEHAYRDAGVDIDLEATAISALVKNITFRRNGQYTMMGGVGHFAGLIDLGPMALAMTVDGVGTKMLVADRQQDWTTVGIDCIAMNVNDLYVMNIEPVAFVDYIATDSLSIEKMAQIGKGLNEGARQANIDIVGGETATLKNLVNGLDLAGTCIGIQKKERIISGDAIQPGNIIVGVPSRGVHSNGLTLARKVVDAHDAWDTRLKSGRTIGEELLTPTRIYNEVLDITASAKVHGMCHITGGGLLNFLRLSKYGFSFSDPLKPHEIFSWIAEAGDVSRFEMYRTFNMGMGYAYVVPEEDAGRICSMVKGAKVVGSVEEKPGIRFMGEEFRS